MAISLIVSNPRSIISFGRLTTLIADQPFAQGLDNSAIEWLIRTSIDHRLEPGELLFHQGEEAAHFFVVAEGAFKLYRLSSTGSEKIVNHVGIGESFAEGVIFMNPPHYPVYAEAIDTSHVIGLSRRTIHEYLWISPQTRMAVMEQLTRRIDRLREEVFSLSLSSNQDRIIRFLLHLVDDNKAEDQAVVTLPMAKQGLASQLSLRPETLSRIFAKLKRERLINLDGASRRIGIPSVRALRNNVVD